MIGGTGYASLGEAIDKAENGATISLQADIALSETITTTKNLTIDLNKYAIASTDCRAIRVNGGTLTLTGQGTVSANKGGEDSKFASGSSVILVSGDDSVAKLVVGSDVTISSEHCYGVTLIGENNKQVLELSGTISVAGEATAISGNGLAKYKETEINIYNGAVVESKKDVSIYHPQKGALNISGGRIEGTTALEAKSGTIAITGDPTFTSNHKGEPTHKANSNGTSTQGYAIAVVDNSAYKGNTSVTIEGGTYTGLVAIAEDNTVDAKKAGKISITGGTFTSDPSDYIAENCAAYQSDGKSVVANANEVYFGETKPSMVGSVQGATIDTPLSGTVDPATYVMDNSEEGSTEFNIVRDFGTLFSQIEGTTQYKVAGDKELAFAHLDFTNLDGAKSYAIMQKNPALNYAYGANAFSDNTKMGVYKGETLLKEGLDFLVSSQSGDITISIVEVADGTTSSTLDADTFKKHTGTATYKNEVSFVKKATDNEVTVNDGTTAEVTIDSSSIPQTNGGENKPTIKIDAVAEDENTGNPVENVTKAVITLPEATINALVDAGTSKVEAVVLKTNAANVSLSGKALEEIAKEVKSGSSAIVNVSKVDKASIDASAPSAGAKFGAIEVTIVTGDAADPTPVPIEGLTEKPIQFSFNIGTGARNPKMFYVEGNDALSDAGVETIKYDRITGIITGSTTHLSTFVAAEKKTSVPGTGGVTATYKLSFNTNGGSSIDAVSKTSGTTVDLAEFVPTREGYTFEGWYSDEALSTKVTSVKLTADTTVYAKWTETVLPFVDVEKDNIFFDDIAFVFSKGMIVGTSDTTFAPKETLTRGMLVTILHRLEGEVAPEAASTFSDVEAGMWYSNAIAWAAENGVVNGYDDTNTFGPNDPVTREQMAAILYNYSSFKGYDVTGSANLSQFGDAESVSDWAANVMAWANAEQLIRGTDDGNLVPQGSTLREQAAAILHRFSDAYEIA
ncbi:MULTISPECIES: S-layer homology domain-containing protein [Gordonibacter]|uniref:S-layer homology domain-containing protein n=1 Tax=Gordonibacter faecis TaxID=3047475 RepID=A0ABT7DMF2_9ACTN|nr:MULTISPECIES: S-layer homology domain-containing protein [unclassified Gordonibacter]MDJ1650432.1 S-layer homology domain-containing protein [Gordonibacter sp. KGMB12511]HIW76724.1 S-layer homology domain-containing protein [Candidatus Gordonibacter avicola]